MWYRTFRTMSIPSILVFTVTALLAPILAVSSAVGFTYGPALFHRSTLIIVVPFVVLAIGEDCLDSSASAKSPGVDDAFLILHAQLTGNL